MLDPAVEAVVWRNNGLSLVLLALFLFCLVGHALSGWQTFNQEQRQHGQTPVSLGQFVVSSEFGETVFENLESEFLQMACYVILTVFLYQRGSSESKKHDGTDEVDEDPRAHRNDRDAPGPVKAGGWRLMLYQNSLSLALVTLFAISFVGHGVAGANRQREDARVHGIEEPMTTLDYMATSHFWYESFQNWQSEFLSVFAIVVLSIRLRQWGSPESKPVHASNDSTGSG